MKNIRKILTFSLIAFALISIGFALGKYAGKSGEQEQTLSAGNGRQVAVYYLHSTFRCVTCNTIEQMTRELLETSYNTELTDGTIQWIEDDFQENETLARQFEVVASCVVVAELKDGEVINYKRLDDVWTKMNDPEAFNTYISEAIDEFLKKSVENS